jgi:acetyl esterase/lipase
MGESSGAHLAVSLGAKIPVRAVVDLYGPMEIVESAVFMEDACTAVGSTLENLYGKEDGFFLTWAWNHLLGGGLVDNQVRKRAEDASPLMHIKSDAAPHLIIHGDLDEHVPVNQSDILATRLFDIGVAHRFYVIRGMHHDYTNAGDVNKVDPDLLDLIFGFIGSL